MIREIKNFLDGLQLTFTNLVLRVGSCILQRVQRWEKQRWGEGSPPTISDL